MVPVAGAIANGPGKPGPLVLLVFYSPAAALFRQVKYSDSDNPTSSSKNACLAFWVPNFGFRMYWTALSRISCRLLPPG